MRFRRAVAVALAALSAAVGLAPPAPAAAATADRWGFAYVGDPTVPAWTTLDTTRQWGSWKSAFPASWAQGAKLAPGRFLVRFPQVGAGSRGVPHVTPVNRTGHYCEVVRWYQSGTDEIVDVQCHKPGGTRDDSPFTVLWTTSSGVLPAGTAHAYLQGGVSGVVQSYNSTGAGVSLAPFGVGQWSVKLPGVGLAGVLAGNVQVTAIQPNAGPRRCKVYRWAPAGTDVVVYVSCFDQAGAPVDTDFALSYHRGRSVIGSLAPPKYFGHLASAAGGPTNDNSLLGVGANTIAPLAPAGRYLVTFKQLGQKETHAQVTAQGFGSHYCHLTQPWSYAPDAPVDVICFDNAGVPTPHDVLVAFTSRI
ncbi:hypothetical protein FHX75_111622 [Micromonospora palomenae]|uniref:Uncharacterized protein n=1 Tax=Micromonospora palomenae TaxID=1461247 RepID=A0A561WX64_9ACTN|nr:hypothetical protein [Micromonospora palomenae]TWG28470.1 hypothetical protein FHX75_111622 [Micromonospora palomenae]